MMAVDVTTTPTFKPGTPKVLFAVPIWGGSNTNNVTRYDVTADGNKFLVNVLGADASGPAAAPVTIVLNWQSELKK